jgi:hypothetical protein
VSPSVLKGCSADLVSETRNRSYVELDEMFEAKVPARHFDKYSTSIDRSKQSAVNSQQV